MALLKDLFKDYLVSYNSFPTTSLIPTTEIEELPTNKYKRMVSYVNTKTDTTPEEPKQETIFTEWVYSGPKKSTVSNATTSWSSPYKDQQSWIADMTAAYKRAGLNDNAIKNLIAKNSLESNWGKSAQGDYNFGNLTTGKSWKGRFVQGGDKDKDGKPISLKFRAYDTLDDYVKDEIQFLTNLYDFNQDDDLSTFLNKLQGGNSAGRRYAEDPHYKNKVKSRYLKI